MKENPLFNCLFAASRSLVLHNYRMMTGDKAKSELHWRS